MPKTPLKTERGLTMYLDEISIDVIKELNVFHTLPDDCEDWDYNCMSYAFGIYEWLIPFNCYKVTPMDIIKELNLNPDNQRLYGHLRFCLDYTDFFDKNMMAYAKKIMLKAFPDLRVVEDFDELKEDEYGISFACSYDDFHFGKYEDGVWTAKCGSSPIYEYESEDDVFGEVYDSPRMRFAMKKNFNHLYSFRDNKIYSMN